jgi:hypothetical protein
MIWLGVGAAGGIYVYRKGERLVERARTEGVTAAALHVARSARSAAELLAAPAAAPVPDRGPDPRGADRERSVRVGRYRLAVGPPPTGQQAAAAPQPPPRAAQAPGVVRDTGTIDITDGAAATAGVRRRRKVR